MSDRRIDHLDRIAKARSEANAQAAYPALIPPLWLMIAAILFVGALAYVTGGFTFDDGRAQYVAARNLWLADCKKPIEVCASDWQFNYELRDIYAAKVPAK